MKYFGATEWRFAAGVSAFCLPIYIVLTLVAVDVIEFFEKSNQVFPLTSMSFFCFLWICLNVPMSYFGAYSAFTTSNQKPPCKISPVRRPIPE